MVKKKREVAQPEWIYLLDAQKIDITPKTIKISANDEERRRLAMRLGLSTLESLDAELTVSRDSGSLVVYISGHIRAKLTQKCVITMETIKSDVVDTFEAWYADPDQAISFARARQERDIENGQVETPILEESEDPEPIIDGQINAGELVAQYLSLAIDLYPRVEGAEIKQPKEKKTKKVEEIYENPFAALKDWKDRQNKD